MKVDQGRRVDAAINKYHLREPNYLRGLKEPEKSKVAAYIQDERTKDVVSESVQAYFKFQVFGKWFSGMIDQLRYNEETKELEVWDIKYSDLPPFMLCNVYSPSLVVYSYAFGAYIGGIININNYNTKAPVYHKIGFHDGRKTTREDVEALVEILENLKGSNWK